MADPYCRLSWVLNESNGTIRVKTINLSQWLELILGRQLVMLIRAFPDISFVDFIKLFKFI